MRLILELIVRDILQQLLAGIGVSRCTAYDGPFGGFGVISGKRTSLNPVGERTHFLNSIDSISENHGVGAGTQALRG